MYGTFNNMAVVKQESPKNATLNKIGGNTDKGDTSSRGTMTVSKERHMSPKHFIFQNKNFQDSQVIFGATKNEVFIGERLEEIKEAKNNN